MKIFYTCDDVEELVASGVDQIELGPGVSITDLAREMAEDHGIKLMSPGSTSVITTHTPPPARTFGDKPSGCQHGYTPPSQSETHNPSTKDNSEGMVGRLVNIVSRMADQGG